MVVERGQVKPHAREADQPLSSRRWSARTVDPRPDVPEPKSCQVSL